MVKKHIRSNYPVDYPLRLIILKEPLFYLRYIINQLALYNRLRLHKNVMQCTQSLYNIIATAMQNLRIDDFSGQNDITSLVLL